MRRTILITLLFLCLSPASPATALHLLSPYGPGASYLEIQAQRRFHDAESDSLRGYDFMLQLGWGLRPSLSAYCLAGLSSSDAYSGGLDFVTAGLRRQLFDRSMLADLIAEIEAFGPGLTATRRRLGYELSQEGDGWGLYQRGSWSWEGDGLNADGNTVVGRRQLLSEGLWMQTSPTVSLLFELRHPQTNGFQSLANGDGDPVWVIGYIRRLDEKIDFLFDASRVPNPESDDGGKLWHFGLGLIVRW